MKKSYQSPEMDVVLFETNVGIMERLDSVTDPDPFEDEDVSSPAREANNPWG